MISLGGVGAALVDKIEFSAENAMVGPLLFLADRGLNPVLAFTTHFEFPRRDSAILFLSLGLILPLRTWKLRRAGYRSGSTLYKFEWVRVMWSGSIFMGMTSCRAGR